MSHIMQFNGHGAYSPSGKVNMTPDEVAAHNADVTARELAHWATQPEVFGPAYYAFPAVTVARREDCKAFAPFCNGATVSTWTSAHLGDIISARVYSHNFGGRMVSMKVRGTNGAYYYGRASWDNGNCIRLRKGRV